MDAEDSKPVENEAEKKMFKEELFNVWYTVYNIDYYTHKCIKFEQKLFLNEKLVKRLGLGVFNNPFR